MKKSQNSYLFWEGPSQIDGAPIIAIITGFQGSQNQKTGDLLSIWIMRADLHPVDAINLGADSSICGECPFRKARSPRGLRMCYVNLNTVFAIYKKYKNGGYSNLPSLETLEGKGVRVGAYGDPAALPLKILRKIQKNANFVLSYTHQYREFPRLKEFCVASCQDQNSYVRAKALGFRTFRVRPTGDGSYYPCEIECLNIKRGITCSECKLCQPGKGPDISLEVHGWKSKVAEFNRRFAGR